MRRFNQYELLAAQAEEKLHERWGIEYEIMFDEKDLCYVVASPANESEGKDPHQPTAVYLGDADEFDDADMLYARALMYTDEVDELVERRNR